MENKNTNPAENTDTAEVKNIAVKVKEILQDWFGDKQSSSKLWIIAIMIIVSWAIAPGVFRGIINDLLTSLGSAAKMGAGLVQRGVRYTRNKGINLTEKLIGALQNYFNDERRRNLRLVLITYPLGCVGLIVIGFFIKIWLLIFLGVFGLLLPIHLITLVIYLLSKKSEEDGKKKSRVFADALNTICGLIYILLIAYSMRLGWGFTLIVLAILGLALLGSGLRKRSTNLFRPLFRLSSVVVGLAIILSIFWSHGLIYNNSAYGRHIIDKFTPKVPAETPTVIMGLGEEAIFYIADFSDTSNIKLMPDTTMPAGTKVEVLKGQTIEDEDGRVFVGVFVRQGKYEKKYYTNENNLVEPTKKPSNGGNRNSYASYAPNANSQTPTTAYFAGQPYALGQCQVTQTDDGYQITAPAGPCLASITGIKVTAGQKFSFQTSGQITGSTNPKDGACQTVGAQGWSYQPAFINGRPLICPQANFMESIGHIVNDAGQVLASFPLRGDVIMPANGLFIIGSNEPLNNCRGQIYNAASDNGGDYAIKMMAQSSAIT